jgi:SIR2-like domain
VFTFNIDDLLEQALAAAKMREGHDYLLIKVPETRPQAVVDQVEVVNGPRIRIVKLHGDYRFGFNYMTSNEIVAYETKYGVLLKNVQRGQQSFAVILFSTSMC